MTTIKSDTAIKQNIIDYAYKFANQYKQKNHLPELPRNSELKPYQDILENKFGEIVKEVENYVAVKNQEITHGINHLKYVATMAGYIAEDECKRQGICVKETEEIVKKAILSGLFHDIERHMGTGNEHMIRGAETAKSILEKHGIQDNIIITAVANHDLIDFSAKTDTVLSIVYGALFDADHFMYGLEREKIFWQREVGKGKSVKDIVNNYDFLPKYQCVWKTGYGKEVGPKFIEFGLAIAEYIKNTFDEK